MTLKRTISGMIGTGSLAHNRREFIAENVDPNRVQLNICYQNENLKEVYKELFDEAVERYNIGKRKDRQITNYYEKIRQGKQEKLFHEVIFQIGNREDMAVGTAEGDLAVKILDEYVKDFQKWNATLRVFGCYLHQDEATPHLHIDFIPYVTDWKGKGMDTRVSLKQALKSLGFQGGNKHDTELNQWMNHEKKVLAEIAKQHGIEWEQKGTHEEHLDVYNFKKKERKKEVQELEQEKEYLTAENEELTAQIAEFRADIQILKDDKEQAIREKQEAEQRAEDAEKEVKSLEERRDVLQPIMDNASKEIKELICTLFTGQTSKEGIFMRYSYEFKLLCVDLYKSGIYPDTPNGTTDERFKKNVREWARMVDSNGPEVLKHKVFNKVWSPEEKLALVSQVIAGKSRTDVALKAGINPGMLYQWVQKYKTIGYNGLVENRKGRPPQISDMKKSTNPNPLTESEREELIRLRAENEYIKAENEVIKKRIALRQEKWAAQLKAKKQQLSKNLEKRDTN